MRLPLSRLGDLATVLRLPCVLPIFGLVLTRIGLLLKGIGVGVSKLCDTHENSVQQVSSRTEIDSRLTSSGGEEKEGY